MQCGNEGEVTLLARSRRQFCIIARLTLRFPV